MFGSMQTRMRQFWGTLRYQTKPVTEEKENIIRLRILGIKIEISFTEE